MKLEKKKKRGNKDYGKKDYNCRKTIVETAEKKCH